MVEIIYGGAEVGSNRVLLEQSGVVNMAMSYWRLYRRGLPTTKPFYERLDPKTRVTLYPGTPTEDVVLSTFEDDYLQFIEANLGIFDAVVEIDMGSQVEQQKHRDRLQNRVGEDRMWVVFDGQDMVALDSLAQRYQHIAVKGDILDATSWLPGRMQALTGLFDTQWHAMAFAKPDEIKRLPLASVVTHAWLSPMMRGETILWEGSRIVRYPKDMKDRARNRAVSIAESAGLDPDKVQDDDHDEVAKLAIWSYQQFEASLRPDHRDDSDDPGSAETQAGAPAHSGVQVRKPVEVQIRPPHERMNLPVVGVTVNQSVEKDENGDTVIRDVPVVQSNQRSVRQCDTCVVKSNCPASKPGSDCAFDLPVQIRTKDQLRAVLNTLIEIQATRALFGHFVEQMNGGYPDENVSKEMDRVFKMTKTVKEIEDNRAFERITIERQGGAGILSAIFGEKAAVTKELPGGGLDPAATDKIIESGP